MPSQAFHSDCLPSPNPHCPLPRPSHPRCGRHRGYNDSRAQREGDSKPAGEERHRDHVHHHRYPEPAEVREPHVSRVCVHLLHRPHDHLPRVAGLLLHPEVSLRQCQGQEPGESLVKKSIAL